jgi:tRNA pseudouridine55 synthase
MNNFYLINKPLKYSSFDVIRVLKKKLNIKKIWHTGTLDPLATGGLLIATGGYTKLIPYLEKDTKEYEFDIMLNGITDSFDLWEEVQFLDKPQQDSFKKLITKEAIQKILEKNFSGKITQVPPKYSALKIAGRRAYDLARKWEEVKMKSREVEISRIKILSFQYPKLSLRASVSAGTYIRSIASDLWEILWTGWYISMLKRTKVWNLDLSTAQNIEDFSKDEILNVETLFSRENFITLDEETLPKIDNGLEVHKLFDFKIWENLFVKKDHVITNIVTFDGKILKPVRKI